MTDLKARKPYKPHNALQVLILTERTRKFLARTDPKALEQAKAAAEAGVDPIELLRDAIFAHHEDAQGACAKPVDPRWGLELVVCNIMDACFQHGFTFEDIVRGAKDVREERAHCGYVAPDFTVTPAEANA